MISEFWYKALSELREGINATKRLLLERCEMRLDVDGVARGICGALPGGARAAAKSVA